MKDNKKYHCKECGAELVEAGSYKWDCPTGCFPVQMELCYMISKKEGGLSDD